MSKQPIIIFILLNHIRGGKMFNSLENILRDLSQALFLVSMPINIIYYTLVKIDKKLEKKLGGKDE